nr:hypothetical protein [Tanacetum cinerariifolium]
MFGYEALLRPTPLPEYPTRDFTLSTCSLQLKAAAPSSKNGNTRGVTNSNAGNYVPKQPSNTFFASTSQASQNLNSKFPVKNGGTNESTCSSNIPTSNPYAALSREFDPETYKRSRDDVESEEEIEVVFDESVETY